MSRTASSDTEDVDEEGEYLGVGHQEGNRI